MAKCKHCNATIEWYFTENGNRMPTNPGLVTIFDPQTQKVYKGFKTHWETCPKANEARKQKK